MAFDEVQFSNEISRGAVSTQQRLTDVVTLRSGFEERNTIWANTRRTFNVALGIQNLDDIYAVQEFWEGRRGALRGFRFKDWSDYKSKAPGATLTNTDQAMLAITATTFQLQKVYSAATNPWTREITKPVNNGTITVADGTGALLETTNYTVDYTTGIVTFGITPTGTPTAGFEFDVPCRFADDSIDISIELVNVGALPDINIKEIRV